MNKQFTEDIIKNYLEQKLYEKRGMSRDEYVSRCKDIWEQTKCEDEGFKLLIDGLYDYSQFENMDDYNDKLLVNQLKNKVKENKLECVCLGIFKWENGELKQVSKDDKAKRNLDDPIEPEERPYLFALFDVLGFEALHSEIGTTRLYQTYKELIDKVTSKDSFSTFQTFNEPTVAWTMMGSMPLRHHYFSDTIILWTPFLPEFISPFCARCSDIICESILMGLPLRGAISTGNAILNKDKGVFLGSPIIEAARVESQQNWIGVSFCPSATDPHFQLSLHPDLLIQNYTEHYKSTNGFNRYASLMTLDWAKRAREKKIDDKIIEKLRNLKNNAPIDKQYYYEQTLSFVQYSATNNDWYKNYKLVVPKPMETVIKITLINGDEIEGALPHFVFKDTQYSQQYFLLVPKENIEIVKELIKEDASFDHDSISKFLYLIPKKAIARQQLFRQAQETKEMSSIKPKEEVENFQVIKIGNSNRNLLKQIPKDLTGLNEALSRIFVGAKNYEIFLPTLNAIHECAKHLIFVNYAIPEGETWNDEGIEILHKIELFGHRDFINAVDRFRKQVDLSRETNEFFLEFLRTYKDVCSTFIADIEDFLLNYDPKYQVSFAPSIMEKERFHLLGLMIKILSHLTHTNEK